MEFSNESADLLRHKLKGLLGKDELLARILPLAGNLDRAKFSRGRLLLKIVEDNGGDREQAIQAALGIEMVHLATLVHDDVIDDADKRRDKASFRSTKGDRGAILFGDYLFSSAIHQIQSTQNQKCAELFTRRVYDTCRGEAIQDLLLTSEDFLPKLEHLHEVAIGKTGALFAFCTEAPGHIGISTSNETLSSMGEIGLLSGLAYQLADDLLDIAGSEENLGKPAGNDLIKNCMTTPLFLMMKELNYSWIELRNHFLENTEELKNQFLESRSFLNLKASLIDLEKQVDHHVKICEASGVKIEKVATYFWQHFVHRRMSYFKDVLS